MWANIREASSVMNEVSHISSVRVDQYPGLGELKCPTQTFIPSMTESQYVHFSTEPDAKNE